MELIQSYLTNNPCFQANVRQADGRYTDFQRKGPRGLMLHSVGCAQPKAEVFCKGWNKEEYDRACVHAFIDAETGEIRQTLPWNYRGWHCGGSGNDTHIGVELCESRYIRYRSDKPWLFELLDAEKARADGLRSYRAAVELFALLCTRYGLDPKRSICSHKEGCAAGIASDHGDPEHYWAGLGLSCTMDGFRADVAAAMGKAPEPDPAPASGGGEEAPLPFVDVSPGAWYAPALRWALAHGIVSGASERFRPEAPCSMAMAVVLLRRLALDLARGGE